MPRRSAAAIKKDIPPLASTIMLRSIGELRPYKRNSRTHSDEQIGQIAASIREFGFTSPVLVDADGEIVAGHARVLAAERLGLDQIPTIDISYLTPTQRRAYLIADNKLALNAGWANDLLTAELTDLRDLGFDLGLMGFSPPDLAEIFATKIGRTDPDDAPAVEAEAVSMAGDVWLCGEHRVLCGDCLDAGAVERLMSGLAADLCFTSPPYLHQRDYEGLEGLDWNVLMRGVFLTGALSERAQLFVNLGLVHRNNEWLSYWDGWIEAMRQEGWRRFGWYVWDQGPGLPGDWNGRLVPAFEFVFHFNRAAKRARKIVRSKLAGKISNGGLRNADGSIGGRHRGPNAIQEKKIPDSVIRITRHKGGLGPAGSHPAPFPVGLPTVFVEAFSEFGAVLFDPFFGSGTTLIAAEMTGRIAYGIEIEPRYVDVAVRRWQNFTGKEARLEGDDATFAQIAAKRGRDS